MSLIGKFFGGKDDDGKKKRQSGRRRPKSAMPQPEKSDAKGATDETKDAGPPKPSKAASRSATPRPGGSGRRGGPSTVLQRPPPRGTAVSSSRNSSTRESGRRKRTSMKGKQIGALLIKAESISESQLNQALQIQQEKGGLLGQILVREGMCVKGAIASAVAKQRTITTVDLTQAEFDPEAIRALPRDFCLEHRLIPFEVLGSFLCVAMSNVLDAQAKNDIKETTQQQPKVFDASWRDIQKAIETYMDENAAPAGAEGGGDAAKEAVGEIVIELPEEELEEVAEPEAVEATDEAVSPRSDDTVVYSPRGKASASEAATPETAAPAPAPATEETTSPASPEPQASEPVEPVEVIDEVEEVDEIEAIDEIEEVEDLAEVEAALTGAAKGEASTPQRTDMDAVQQPLRPIPLSDEWLDAVIENGGVGGARRWLAERTAATVLPAEPAPDWERS